MNDEIIIGAIVGAVFIAVKFIDHIVKKKNDNEIIVKLDKIIDLSYGGETDHAVIKEQLNGMEKRK